MLDLGRSRHEDLRSHDLRLEEAIENEGMRGAVFGQEPAKVASQVRNVLEGRDLLKIISSDRFVSRNIESALAAAPRVEDGAITGQFVKSKNFGVCLAPHLHLRLF